MLVVRPIRGHDGQVADSTCQRPVENRRPVMTPVVNDLLNRAKREYVEMPGLVLTIRQASRLWNLDAGVCHTLLSTLLREESLSQTRLSGSSQSSRGFQGQPVHRRSGAWESCAQVCVQRNVDDTDAVTQGRNRLGA